MGVEVAGAAVPTGESAGRGNTAGIAGPMGVAAPTGVIGAVMSLGSGGAGTAKAAASAVDHIEHAATAGFEGTAAAAAAEVPSSAPGAFSVPGEACPVVGRFAPSPTGRMHLGNILASLLAWLSVRSQGGKLVLRIEDLDDRARSGPWDTLLMDDLRWLGLDWDEGPYYQTDRLELYADAVGRLDAMGLVYPCFCTRAELHAASAPHASDGTPVYVGTCRGLTAAQVAERSRVRPPALRLRVPVAQSEGSSATRSDFRSFECTHSKDQKPDFGDLRPRVHTLEACAASAPGGEGVLPGAVGPRCVATFANVADRAPGVIRFEDRTFGPQHEVLATECGDFLIRRSDGVYAYQLAVVVDDAAMGVTEVVRGCDLLGSTARQMYLQDLLGYDHPSYAHVPLLVAPDGRRLSKRDRDCDMAELRARFGTPEALLGKLAYVAGLTESDEPCSAAQLADKFSWEIVRACRDAIVVDGATF